MPIRFHEAARADVLDAVRFLESRSPGLGGRFWEELQSALAGIEASPLAATEILPGVRRRLLDKFRYGVVYLPAETAGILIVAVPHLSRRPFYWRRRLEERGY